MTAQPEQPFGTVTVRPGDTLLLFTPAPWREEDITRITKEFADRVPGVKVCVIENTAGAAVYRPEAQTPTE